MMHRVGVMRMIAVILTFGLSAQSVHAQVVDCTTMRAAQAGDDHSRMTQHEHRASEYPTASSDAQDWSASNSCNQTMMCVNAPAIPIAAMNAVSVDKTESLISFAAGVLEPRTFSPEPPPPRS